MTWKCYQGNPIEFRGTYQWALYHAKTMLNFTWVHNPYSIPIGKGFYVEPKLMHTYPSLPPGYQVKHPSLPSELNLIVNGPGLPKNGQEVALKWASSSCLSGVSKAFCMQFMDMQTVKAASGSSVFTIDFIGGYSEQQFGESQGNVAFWRVCCAGPFVQVQKEAHLPDWKWFETVMTFWWLINKIEECGDTADCDVPEKLPVDPIDVTITELAQTQVPKDQQGQRRETLERLEQIRTEMSEAESLVRRSNEVTSKGEKLELRTVAIDHLKKAHELKRRVVRLLARLEEALEESREK